MYNTGQRPSVLLVNQYFPPDTSATAQIFSDLVSALSDAGHRVDVLCGRPSYRPTERPGWRPLGRKRASEHVVVERVGSAARELSSTRARVLNYLSYLVLAALRVVLRRRPDLVIAGTDPPLAILVGLAAARGRPVLYHLQDLHPEAALAAGWLPDGRIAAAWERVHLFALRRAALVVCLGRDMAARLEAKGVPPERIAVVPNGSPPAEGTPDPALVARLRGSDRFVVVHAGNLGVAGAWESIAEAARILDGDARFVCVGGGAREAELREWGFRVEPFQTDVASVMAAGDVQLVTQRSDMQGLLVPSKLYAALAHGRPVLAVAPSGSELAATVREWECGLVADPEDPADIAEKVRELTRSGETLDAMAERALAAGEQHVRADLFAGLVQRLEGLLDENKLSRA